MPGAWYHWKVEYHGQRSYEQLELSDKCRIIKYLAVSLVYLVLLFSILIFSQYQANTLFLYPQKHTAHTDKNIKTQLLFFI